MQPYGFVISMSILTIFHRSRAQCPGQQAATFARWAGAYPAHATPVFVYSASGDEESLSGACLARCRELQDCAGVVVAYGKGNCHGVADAIEESLRADSDVAYFKKICQNLSDQCGSRWWAVEVTPGYHLNSESDGFKLVINATIDECYGAMLGSANEQQYRSAQWINLEETTSSDLVAVSEKTVGNCVLNVEDKFTEPESYRVSNHYTFYMENQCRHDYPKKIDRCSYEEYYNQTLRHVEFTYKNNTKDECKTSCELEERFICRGFSWTVADPGAPRGICDLHSEDLITTGSWLLRRTSHAVYYRRVICLNITVECEGSHMIVTYRPRGAFRGRVYVPGRGEPCGARGGGGAVRLPLPLHGDCDVHFAYAITNTPAGVVNRTMAYVMVMIQNNPIIQTAGDRWVRVGCSPDVRHATRVDATVAVRDTGKPSLASEAGSPANAPAAASAVYAMGAAPLTMYVVRADDAAGAVALGEPLELRIETTDEAEIEAYHLVASSRLGDSSVLLLDSKGCPTGQVDFPAFSRKRLGGTQRLTAKFKAFRFPTSHVVRFALMVRFCQDKCTPLKCLSSQARNARETNDTLYDWSEDPVPAGVVEDNGFREGDRGGAESDRGVVAQGGAVGCGGGAGGGRVPLELEMVVGARDVLSADTLIRADHREADPAGPPAPPAPPAPSPAGGAVVCVHELLLVALALSWLAVQALLLLGCCVLVNRYRNLAEMNMQKDYHSFDNVGFDTSSTHRRVHWPDQGIDMLHGT